MHRIMLVDDEPNVLSSLRRLLSLGRRQDWVVEAHTDPCKALQRIHEVAFDVVVCDYHMPQMDGVSFLLKVREIQPLAVRMVLSGSCDFGVLQSAVNRAEIFRFIAKPWLDADVLEQVNAALQRALSIKEDSRLVDHARVGTGELSRQEAERRRLEALEPGITQVQWGPCGEVLMPHVLLGEGGTGP